MHIVYTERHKLHATEDVWVDGQPLIVEEVPARVEIILEAVRAANLGPVAAPTDHGMAPILAVHDAGFVEHLRTAYTENAAQLGEPATVLAGTFATRYAGPRPTSFRALVGYYAYGAGAPILAGTWEAAYWSAQCALSAADLVRAGERAAYALCRPPGHHAAQDLYGGFCYLNNVAIAARRLHSEGKVAILDIDYHHGNGTQAIFYTDPAVLYGSLHADPDRAYPYYWGYANERGAGPGEGTNYNWPLPRGTGDADYLATLDQALATIRRFKPRFCVVSVGYDTAVGDAVGGFNITTDGFRAIGEHIAGLGLPTLLVQEGGYRLDTLGENAVAFLKAFSTA
jgi:acetoin utilization deacetylase AcuC-like enzyme